MFIDINIQDQDQDQDRDQDREGETTNQTPATKQSYNTNIERNKQNRQGTWQPLLEGLAIWTAGWCTTVLQATTFTRRQQHTFWYMVLAAIPNPNWPIIDRGVLFGLASSTGGMDRGGLTPLKNVPYSPKHCSMRSHKEGIQLWIPTAIYY